jgi:hypothetical protein
MDRDFCLQSRFKIRDIAYRELCSGGRVIETANIARSIASAQGTMAKGNA